MITPNRLEVVKGLIVALLPLLLAACQLAPDAELPTATPIPLKDQPEMAEVPALHSPIDKSLEKNYDEKAYPRATAVLWANGFLWTANESGLLTRWDVNAWQYQQHRLPGEPVIHALAGDKGAIYAGTERGDIWRLSDDGSQTQVVAGEFGRVSAIALDRDNNLWIANANHPDQADSRGRTGGGLVFLEAGGKKKIYYNLADAEQANNAPLKSITALAFDPKTATLWIGTYSTGLLSYYVDSGEWQAYNTSNSRLESDTINDLKLAPDGSLWLATASGVSVYRNGVWEAEAPIDEGALWLAIAGDDTVWVAGQSVIARINRGETWQIYRVPDNPLLSDRFRFVVLDDEDYPWFIGRRGKIRFDGQAWIAYDADVRRFAEFAPVQSPVAITPPPRNFPSPTKDYVEWLEAWPRPKADNGRGIHFLQTHQFDAIEVQKQVNRMKRLGMRWALVHYADHGQLVCTAPIFQEAGITVVWRPFVRPYETYDSWAEDVKFLRSRGVAPYIQLYNEPSLAQEWEDHHPIDQEAYLHNLLPAAQQIYDAGGYVGLQFVNPDWLRLTLQTMKAQGMSDILARLFFIPHLYGLNHPPAYDEDINSVLGFREFAKIFEEEIGLVPVMIAGEGGWRLGEAQDNRYPAISETLHRDYHLAVFDWFRTGELANGEALPDYFFAFCPWLISDPDDPAAWFDSDSGDRTLTIEAVEAMFAFERKFSWDE